MCLDRYSYRGGCYHSIMIRGPCRKDWKAYALGCFPTARQLLGNPAPCYEPRDRGVIDGPCPTCCRQAMSAAAFQGSGGGPRRNIGPATRPAPLPQSVVPFGEQPPRSEPLGRANNGYDLYKPLPPTPTDSPVEGEPFWPQDVTTTRTIATRRGSPQHLSLQIPCEGADYENFDDYYDSSPYPVRTAPATTQQPVSWSAYPASYKPPADRTSSMANQDYRDTRSRHDSAAPSRYRDSTTTRYDATPDSSVSDGQTRIRRSRVRASGPQRAARRDSYIPQPPRPASPPQTLSQLFAHRNELPGSLSNLYRRTHIGVVRDDESFVCVDSSHIEQRY